MKEAVTEFQAAVRCDPTYAAGHFNLASALAQLDRYDEAIPEFTEALRLNPAHPQAGRLLAACRRKPGEGLPGTSYR